MHIVFKASFVVDPRSGTIELKSTNPRFSLSSDSLVVRNALVGFFSVSSVSVNFKLLFPDQPSGKSLFSKKC
jgi:hypothetical protein